MSEGEIQVTASEVERFMQGSVWRAIVQAIATRSMDLTEENNEIDPVKEPTKIARNQGMVSALGFVVDLPQVLMETAEHDREVGEAQQRLREEGDKNDAR